MNEQSLYKQTLQNQLVLPKQTNPSRAHVQVAESFFFKRADGEWSVMFSSG